MGIQALRNWISQKERKKWRKNTIREIRDLSIVSGFLSIFFFKANQAGICTQLFELRMFLEQRLQWSRSWSLPVIDILLSKPQSFLSFMSFLSHFPIHIRISDERLYLQYMSSFHLVKSLKGWGSQSSDPLTQQWTQDDQSQQNKNVNGGRGFHVFVSR